MYKVTQSNTVRNGKYRYPEDSFLRPRTKDEIVKGGKERERRMGDKIAKEKERLDMKMDAEIKNYKKYRVTKKNNSG